MAGVAFGVGAGSVTAITEHCTGQMTSYPFWPICGDGHVDLDCKIEAQCTTGVHGVTTTPTVTEDYPDVDDLRNCAGALQTSSC